MKKFKIVNENDSWVAYCKRNVLGWKRLTPIGMATIYEAVKFLSENYGTPLFYEDSDNEIEIVK